MSEVTWRTIGIESADEDVEALSERLWESCDSLTGSHTPEDGEAAAATASSTQSLSTAGSHAARVSSGDSRVGEIVPRRETNYFGTAVPQPRHIFGYKAFPQILKSRWQLLVATDLGDRPGSSSSFTSALADLVTGADETDSPEPTN